MNRFADRLALTGPLSFWAGHGLAAGSTALAALARWLVPWALTPAPYLGFYPAVVVSAALGGVGPGLVATFASLLLVNFVFGHFNVHDHGAVARQVIWVTASLGVSLLAGMQRKARMRERRQAEELCRWNDELEERVAAQTVEIRKTNETLEQQVAERTSALQSTNSELEESRRVATTLLEDALGVRRQAQESEAALRESEERLRFALDTCHIGAWDISLEDHSAYRSLEHDRIFGYAELLPEWTLEMFLHHALPEYRSEVESMVREATEARTGWTYECRIRRTDGEIRWIWFSGRYSTDVSGHSRVAGVVQDITDRKLAEEALREGEEQFRTLADAIPQLCWTANADGWIFWYNRRWYEYTGTTPEQMEGWGWQSVHDPAVLPDVMVRWQASIATGKPFDMVFPLLGADGVFRPFLTRIMPVCDQSGKVARWFGTNTDISEQRRTEEALRESEEKLSMALRSAGMGAWRLELGDQRRQFDDQVCHCLGIDPARFDGTAEAFVATVHPDDRDALAAALQKTIEGGAPYVVEYRAVWPDGRIRHIASRGRLARDVAGEPQWVDGLLWDITERKRVEEDLQATLQRFYTVLASMYYGILLVTNDGQVEFANQAFCDLFGLAEAPADLVGLAAGETLEKIKHAYLHPDEAFARIREIVGRGRPVKGEELSMLGGGTWLRDFVPLDLLGKSYGRLWLHFDITERKRSEESLREAHDELAKQMEQRTRDLREKEVLLKEIHHRVKNNLQVISSLVNLQADGTSDETVRAVLRDVTHRVRSMALVHEKLYQSADLAHIDFAEYARSLLGYLWRAHGAKAAAVRLTFDLESLSLPVDAAVPCGLILNELAGNALKHAFPDQSVGDVAVSLHLDANRLVSMSVRDNGVGLPEGLDWRQARSLGLRLVQMLAGQLHGTSELNRLDGTEFLITFKLPETALDGETSHG